jgi:hypothetical protein
VCHQTKKVNKAEEVTHLFPNIAFGKTVYFDGATTFRRTAFIITTLSDNVF